jgi:hypothetical protein
MDRFEVMDIGTKALPLQLAVAVIKKVPVLKWLAQIASQGSLVLALKEREL